MESVKLLNLLKDMQRIRSMEELCAELYTQEKIRGFLHLYIGEEAVAAGVMSLLKPEDNVLGTYREHAHALLKGVSARKIFAEMFGRVDGCSRGRGGSMHLYSKPERFFGGTAIVASGIPQAVGLAFASKQLKENRHTICFFGEGAMAEGAFHEAMNMASLWKIPILFCCENNFYAMGTALSRSQSQTNLVLKAKAYVMEAESVDGMNVIDVVEKTSRALEFISKEQRPYFLEFQTYRFRPHSMFDPELYREKKEVEQWKTKDPIAFAKNEIIKNLTFEDEQKNFVNEWEKTLKEIQNEMKDAIQFADNSPLEDVSNLHLESW